MQLKYPAAAVSKTICDSPQSDHINIIEDVVVNEEHVGKMKNYDVVEDVVTHAMKKKSDSSPKKKMALLTQSPNNVYPALTNRIEDNNSTSPQHMKNVSYIDNGGPPGGHISKMKVVQPSSTVFVMNPISKQNGNCSSNSSEGDLSPRQTQSISPPHKTSQNRPPKFKLLNRSSAVTAAPISNNPATNGIDIGEHINVLEDHDDDVIIEPDGTYEINNTDTNSIQDDSSNPPLLIDKDKQLLSTPIKTANSTSVTTPSKQASVEYSSSPSSTTSSLNRENSLDYKDSTGVDLHEFMVKTLRENPRDRLMLLKLERDFTEFITNPHKMCYKYPPMTSYHRMLIHRVAAYFGLDHNVDSTGKSVVISKTPSSRVPGVRFQVFCSREYTDEEISAVPKSILLRASSSDELVGTPPRYESPLILDARYMGMEDKKSRSIEEREEDYIKAKERIFQKDSSLELGDEVLSPDGAARLLEVQNSDVPLSEKESAIAAVAAATGRKANHNKRKNIGSLQLEQSQYGYPWQQGDSNASTPSECYTVAGYTMNAANYQAAAQMQTIEGYQGQPSAAVAINAQTGQPLLGSDGNPTYYPSHYNSAAGQQIAYVNANGTATYMTAQSVGATGANGQYAPAVYYMNNVQAAQQAAQQQQQQQQQQYYMVQQTPTGQLVYIPTHQGVPTDASNNPSSVVSPQAAASQVQYQDYTNQLSNMSMEQRRISVSNEEETKTKPSTPTSPVDTASMAEQNKQMEYQSAQGKAVYYMHNGRAVRGPSAVYHQQQQAAYPVQYIQTASTQGYPSYAASQQVEQTDVSQQYAHIANLSHMPTVVQQVRMPSGVIQQQYVTPTVPQQTQSYAPRVALQQQQYHTHINASQKPRFVSGVLPNPAGPTANPVYVPLGSAAHHTAAAMLMNGQYAANLQQVQHMKQSGDNTVKNTATVDTTDNSILTSNGRISTTQQRYIMQMQPNYHPTAYSYMTQQTQRYVTNPMYVGQMIRPPTQRKFRATRPNTNNQQIRISRPNSTSSDIDQKTVSHILEIFDFPDTVTSDADAIFDEIKSSGARILKINSSSSQTLPNGIVTNSSTSQRPTILAIFKSANEAQQALETVSSPYYKLRVSQKSPTHFSGSEYPNQSATAKQ